MPFFAPAEFFERYPAEQVRMPEVLADDLDDIPAGGMALWEKTRWFFDGMMKYDKEEPGTWRERSEEHTSELQSLMRTSFAVFCLKKKTNVHIGCTRGRI